ncbi:efflux RND transporter periplasmic adaptor subunit [Legionella oakridgensis]|nr:efflux RND transporter periplasmic adaptor subunit [Legionella oakridgensis]
MPNKLVEVETVKKQKFQQTIRLLGTIHPKHATVLIAKGTGMLDTLIPSGQRVSKGTLIAKIDNPDLEHNLMLSIHKEILAKTQYERMSPLLKQGFVSAKEIEEKKQAWIEAQKESSKARMELENLRFYAPFDGLIGAYKRREGVQVNLGDAVVTVYDPSSLVVDVDIPCGNLSLIQQGQSVNVLGKPYSLSHFQKMLDEETHMCPADIDIDCENCLVGSTVDVNLVVAERRGVIVIPWQAMFLRNGEPHVYIAHEGKVVLIAVKTGLKQQDKIEVVEGLKSGQQVIIKGQERLYPGMMVDLYQPNTNKMVS